VSSILIVYVFFPTSDLDLQKSLTWNVDMSDPPVKQLKKSRLLRVNNWDLFSRRKSLTLSSRAQSATPHNASAAWPMNSLRPRSIHKAPNIRQSSSFQPRE
jgi:hypothetical protein